MQIAIVLIPEYTLKMYKSKKKKTILVQQKYTL